MSDVNPVVESGDAQSAGSNPGAGIHYGIKELLSILPSSSSKEDIDLVTKAYAFAEKAHTGHMRFSGEPYMVHLFETAKSLAELSMGAETIAAGLLHDSIEDRGVRDEEIRREFGEEILFLIQGVTKLGELKYRGLERHTESLRKLFVATSQDIRVVIIKLMDRLHNIRTLSFVPKEKQGRIAAETLEIYVPIADRLGMGKFKQELEDLSFPYVYPKEYEEALSLMKQKKNETERRLEKILNTLRKELAQQRVTNFRTERRLKGLYSLYRKYERKGRDIEKIHDLSALRIIVPTIADCYRVLGIVHSLWRPLPGEIKDYIAFPKPNGYQSLHTKILTGDGGIAEIQIRTEDMHRTAEYGIASHGLYKENVGYKDKTPGGEHSSYLQWVRQLLPLLSRLPTLRSSLPAGAAAAKEEEKKEQKTPRWLKEIAETQNFVSGSKEFLEDLKSDFFSHRVFVFTPKGDVIDLPIDSSPVDFAYAVHSDIGDHMAGVKVNGKMVALDTRLHNGDIVEIITKLSAHPTSKWVDLAKTALARKHIRNVLEKQSSKIK
ncbi:hypothetical protein A3A35_01655 [Candidatus Kaiserbacteria bacterium RIFCSPLOWO2_01_FULL_51_21]|uniref:TGS domain-containing protein n=1 Tax=Candidatus Kaiserbacteria bacterium RIFCSPLOWO2_01_FULL_51_21 TaxID=1798508 RepID=A0A1F6ED68_9BACT|nr:MAG: hypothetical protein A3A35_01655 [Candidatus Kaiserbacteria bacterium RIFCSPLOWO2_01_FULL_51_21]